MARPVSDPFSGYECGRRLLGVLWLLLCVGACEKAPTTDDAGKDDSLTRAQALLEQGQVTAARTLLEESLRGHPSPALHRALLRCELLATDCRAARSHADALRTSSHADDALEGRTFGGLIDLCLGDRAAAHTVLAASAEATSPSLAAVAGYAAAVRTAKDRHHARDRLSAWRVHSGAATPASMIARGALAQLAGEGQDAEDWYERALEAEGKGVDPALSAVLAAGYARSGRLPPALTHLQVALAAAPSQQALALRLAELALDADLGELAEHALDKLPEQQPEGATRVLLRARVDIARGHPERAVTRLDAALARSRQPTETSALSVLRARARIAAGNPTLAWKELETLHARAPLDASVTDLWLARLVATGQLGAALAGAEAWLAAAPAEARALRWKARILVQQEQYAAAAEVYMALGKLDPDDVTAQTELAHALQQSGLLQAARRTLEAALQRAPDSPIALQALLDWSLAQDDREAALQRATEQARKVPNSADIQRILGEQLEAAGRTGTARTAYLRATNLAPRDARNWQALARFNARQDSELSGVWVLRRAMERAKPNYPLLGALAELEDDAGEYAEAQAHYEALLALAPHAPRILAALADLLTRTHEPDLARAQQLAEQARTLAPQDAAVVETLGWVRAQQGEWGEAIALLRDAVSAQPTSARAQYRLGVALSEAGKRREGERALRQALQLSRQFQGARDARERLAALATH